MVIVCIKGSPWRVIGSPLNWCSECFSGRCSSDMARSWNSRWTLALFLFVDIFSAQLSHPQHLQLLHAWLVQENGQPCVAVRGPSPWVHPDWSRWGTCTWRNESQGPKHCRLECFLLRSVYTPQWCWKLSNHPEKQLTEIWGAASLQVSYTDYMIQVLMEPLLQPRTPRPVDKGNLYEGTGLVRVESRWMDLSLPPATLLSVPLPILELLWLFYHEE